MNPLEQFLRDHPALEVLAQLLFWWMFVATAWASSLIVLAVAPHRHQRAACTVAQRPWRSLAAGVPVTVLPVMLFLVLIEQRAPHGHQALLLILMLATATGMGVCGRTIATRLWPARASTLTTARGAGLLALTALFPAVGILAVIIASCLGAGAYLLPAGAIGDE